MVKNDREGAREATTPWKRVWPSVREQIDARFDRRTALAIGGIVLAGMLMIALILVVDRGGAGETVAEAGLLDYPRGPHGARLLSDGPLQLEMTIYETGVPPQFRIYPFDSALRPIPPSEVSLQVVLRRLGGRIDRIGFKPESDYLQGQNVVEEPHSFDVDVTANYKGKEYKWTYSQIEGKVELGPDQVKSAGIGVNTVGPRTMITTLELPGEIKVDETRLAHVVPRLRGVVTGVYKKEGDRVRRGELMAVVNSRELADATSSYVSAVRQVEFARVKLAREESLWRKKISAENDYLEARRAFEEADQRRQLAGQMLVVLGVPSGSLRRLASPSAQSLSRFEIRSPLDGEVLERNITVGETVSEEEAIFTVADMSSVWIDVTVYAKDIGSVREGQPATVRSSDLGSSVSGRVSYIGPLVGQDTRAATARIVLPNAGAQWRPGLFVAVHLVLQSTTIPLAVPTEAIQTFRDWKVVFIRSGNWFEARPVELGRSDGEWVEVLSGLSPGEQYAAVNSFAVKAEIGKLGASHDH